MDTPKFQIPGRPRGRQPGDTAKSVKEMAWANQKPDSLFDFIRGRFLALLLMVGILGAGFSVLNRTATKPENQRKAPRASRSPEDPPTGGTFVVPHTAETTDGVPAAPPAEEGPAAAEKKDGETKKPEKDADSPPFPRTFYPRKEAMVHTFKEPLPEFEPLATLDYKSDSFHELYALVMDEDLRTPVGRANASNYAYAAEIIYHYYRFLRTNLDKPEKIEEYYRTRKAELTDLMGGPRQAEANYVNTMKNPVPYRGQIYSFHGVLMQKYQIRVWAKDEDNNSGIQETWLLVCRDLKYRDQLYGVLVPHSARHLNSRDEIDNADLVAWKGLFLQRWPYRQKDQLSGEMPLYVAWTADRLKQPPLTQGTNWVLVGLGALLCIALLFVFWQTSRDDKRADTFRRNLRRKPDATKKGAASEQEQPETAGSTPTPATEPPMGDPPANDGNADPAPPQD